MKKHNEINLKQIKSVVQSIFLSIFVNFSVLNLSEISIIYYFNKKMSDQSNFFRGRPNSRTIHFPSHSFPLLDQIDSYYLDNDRALYNTRVRTFLYRPFDLDFEWSGKSGKNSTFQEKKINSRL